MDPTREYWTRHEAAEWLRCSIQTLDRRVALVKDPAKEPWKKSKIRAVRDGRRVLIVGGDVLKILPITTTADSAQDRALQSLKDASSAIRQSSLQRSAFDSGPTVHVPDAGIGNPYCSIYGAGGGGGVFLPSSSAGQSPSPLSASSTSSNDNPTP